eukprot:GHVT01069043.1.p1 GENE.GHVT01069043.1~~GHVT01069043.1.p1  ORF type:complete len:292 (-),score=21.34 GHVT01069043.1:2409-3284(-)
MAKVHVPHIVPVVSFPCVSFHCSCSLAQAGEKAKLKKLQQLFHRRYVMGVDLKTKQAMMIFVAVLVILVVVMLAISITAFALDDPVAGSVTLVCTVLVGLIYYFVAGRGMTTVMLKRSVKRCEAAFREFRPNVIVAYSFGAVVAFRMDVPRVPMVLIAPAHDQFARYMRDDSAGTSGATSNGLASLEEFPYVIIVHGTSDTSVPLDDSIRLIETGKVGRCRLEIVDDNHKMDKVDAEELKQWVEEAYDRGREQVGKMAEEGFKKVDLSLFSVPVAKGVENPLPSPGSPARF